MPTILSLKAREILDSRGNPTVEAEVTTEQGVFRACCPSGASTGIYEAKELRDGDENRYLGKGVLQAVENVNKIIAPAFIGKDPTHQAELDTMMTEQLDGSKNEYGFTKSKLGANATTAVSFALARAGAAAKGVPLYKYIAELAGNDTGKFVMPVPSFNVLNGGKHAGNALAPQEFMIFPVGAPSFKEALRYGAEVYHTLKSVIKKKYGLGATNIGDEGGFAPDIATPEEALDLITEAINICGYSGKIKICLDPAASEFFVEDKKCYDLNFKCKDSRNYLSSEELTNMWKNICSKYDIASIEDPFDQDDYEAYASLTNQVGEKVQIMGDDLFVTNMSRLKIGKEKGACNALLLKVNQIGTVTEAIAAFDLARSFGWGIQVSHRSGETEDTFIADLTVGLGTGQLKTGAPCRSERVAKYNQLMRIEEELGDNCVFAGANFRKPVARIR
ncbi:enolase (2-phosphoglycerate dehydratase) [Cryptosporidium canis]|uniref:phosphopyruvate hydratase n=1 Tax=Cryptosporidium canis TaxID=195482 RepID=A0A9D5HYU5_9CRYT|nr:enolase (2-phosphoglycerate dehydratase) [Cryptosporidium canis]